MAKERNIMKKTGSLILALIVLAVLLFPAHATIHAPLGTIFKPIAFDWGPYQVDTSWHRTTVEVRAPIWVVGALQLGIWRHDV